MCALSRGWTTFFLLREMFPASFFQLSRFLKQSVVQSTRFQGSR